ncbi:hypothetical protein BC830DRAFT_611917 [Chytriomyces sp. MP71]|nr:hypothetical protein BC830DRAFT_611917 [Chytriomyces sp. MP71]
MQPFIVYSLCVVIFNVPTLVLYVLILLGNVLHLLRLSPSSFLIFFLCVGSFINTANELIVCASHLISGVNSYDTRACLIQSVLVTFGCLLSITQGSGLTLLRYLSIVRKQKIHYSYVSIFTATSTAVCILLVTIPFILGSQNETYGMHPSGVVCTVLWFKTDIQTRVVACICGVFCAIPVCFIGFAYAAIYARVSKVISEASGTLEESGQSNEGTPGSAVAVLPGQPKGLKLHQEQRREYEQSQKKLLIQSIVIVSVMLAGWGPYCIMGFAEVLMGSPVTIEVELTADALVAAMELINAVVVLWFDAEIRANVVNLGGYFHKVV